MHSWLGIPHLVNVLTHFVNKTRHLRVFRRLMFDTLYSHRAVSECTGTRINLVDRQPLKFLQQVSIQTTLALAYPVLGILQYG